MTTNTVVSDPSDVNEVESCAHLEDPEPVAIGIDLGTTYSCAAVFIKGKVETIPNDDGELTTPSWVAFDENGSYSVGDVAKFTFSTNPTGTIFDAKRLIGRKFSDYVVQNDKKLWPFQVIDFEQTDTPKIQVFGKTYHPEEISARVLQKMKLIAEDYLNRPVRNAVVTVPAYFKNGQRQATKHAGEIAGLNILKVINEPTAAVLAYSLHRSDTSPKNVLIFDLGGGTFDVTVFTIEGENIDVKGVGGDTHLGGQDFDQELVKLYIQKYKKTYEIDLDAMNVSDFKTAKALKRIWFECEKRKRHLSVKEKVVLSLDAVYKDNDLDVTVTREQFEQLNQSKFDRCMDIVKSVLKESKMKKEDIDDIVLVGGSTRIPKIRSMLSDYFNGKVLIKDIDPEQAVARGAAIQAAILNGKQAGDCPLIQTKEIVPFSLGVEHTHVNDKKMSVFIPKNTVIPNNGYSVLQSRITARDWQTEASIEIFEGEDPIARNNYFLGKFTVTNIPRARAGEEKVLTKMEVNTDGILTMTATVMSNNKSSSITILPNQGRLSEDQIAELKLQ